MTVVIGHVNGGAQHQSAEWDARDPGVEREDQEGHKNQGNDATDILLPIQHVYGSGQAPHNVQDSREPNDLLGSDAHEEDVANTEDDSNNKCKGEKNQGVRVDSEDFGVVDAGTVGVSRSSWEFSARQQLLLGS